MWLALRNEPSRHIIYQTKFVISSILQDLYFRTFGITFVHTCRNNRITFCLMVNECLGTNNHNIPYEQQLADSTLSSDAAEKPQRRG